MPFDLLDGSPELAVIAALYNGLDNVLAGAHAMGLSWDQKGDLLRKLTRHGLAVDERPVRITDWGRAVYEAHCSEPTGKMQVTIPPNRWTRGDPVRAPAVEATTGRPSRRHSR